MTKTPSKPKPTAASTQTLIDHYNSQVEAYNAVLTAMPEKKRPETGFQVEAQLLENGSIAFPAHPNTCNEIMDRAGLVGLIRRQNHRLKRHIKTRALQLLYTKVRETEEQEEGLVLADRADKDAPLVLKDGKYTVGYTYQHILKILRDEFPENSTSVACLRWYVVHERSWAVDQGLDWPDLPHFRPRSSDKGA